MPVPAALGSELRDLRLDRGLNQDQVAERAAMSESIECGDRSG